MNDCFPLNTTSIEQYIPPHFSLSLPQQTSTSCIFETQFRWERMVWFSAGVNPVLLASLEQSWFTWADDLSVYILRYIYPANLSTMLSIPYSLKLSWLFEAGIALISLLCCVSRKWASWKARCPPCRKITLQGYILQHDGWAPEGFRVQDQSSQQNKISQKPGC